MTRAFARPSKGGAHLNESPNAFVEVPFIEVAFSQEDRS
jgi:hypothetical protein